MGTIPDIITPTDDVGPNIPHISVILPIRSVGLFTCTGITQYRRCKLNISLLPECNSTTAIADDKQSDDSLVWSVHLLYIHGECIRT